MAIINGHYYDGPFLFPSVDPSVWFCSWPPSVSSLHPHQTGGLPAPPAPALAFPLPARFCCPWRTPGCTCCSLLLLPHTCPASLPFPPNCLPLPPFAHWEENLSSLTYMLITLSPYACIWPCFMACMPSIFCLCFLSLCLITPATMCSAH